jgi:hypothetical protein
MAPKNGRPSKGLRARGGGKGRLEPPADGIMESDAFLHRIASRGV